MKKFRLIPVIAIIAVLSFAASVAYTFNTPPDLSQFSGSIAIDGNGGLYLNYNTEDRYTVMRLNSDSTIDYYYTSNINTADIMSFHSGLYTDTVNDRVYSICSVLDNITNVFIKNSIVYIDTNNGNKPQTLYESEISANYPEFIDYVSSSQEGVYFSTRSGDYRTACLYLLSPGSARPAKLQSYTLPDTAQVYKTAISGNNLLVLTMDAKIYRVSADGSPVSLFPAKEFSGRCFPSSLYVDEQGRLHFMEVYSKTLLTIDVATGNTLESLEASTPIYPGSSYDQSSIADFAVLDNANRAFIVADKKSGKLTPVIIQSDKPYLLGELKYTPAIAVSQSLNIFYIVLIACLLILAVGAFYRWMFIKRPPVLIKLATTVLPITAVGMLAFSYITLNVFDSSISRERLALVYNTSDYAVQNIDASLLQKINSPGDAALPEYGKLLDSITKASVISGNVSDASIDYPIYCILTRVENGDFFTAVSADMPCFMPLDNIYSQSSIDLYKHAYSERKIVTGTIWDYQGTWTVAIHPVYDAMGNITGMLETGINSKDLVATKLNLKNILLMIGSIVTLVVFFAFLISFKLSLKPLKRLKGAVISVYNGNYGIQTSINTNDEFADIGRAFNKMSLDLKAQFDKLKMLNEAYFRFVPQETFSMLNKGSILDVKLGDQVIKDMTIIASSLRGFKEVSLNMNSEQLLNYANSAFSVVSRTVSRHSGIIHSYNINRITALYESSPEDALLSVINIREEFAKGSIAVRNSSQTGFFIHKSPVVFGIIGEQNRYFPATVAENTDIMHHLENISEKLMCPLIVTEPAFICIPNVDDYHYRYIGYLFIEKSSSNIDLYEFFDGDEHSILSAKERTLPAFKKALNYYLNKDFYAARNTFGTILKDNPDDDTTRWYLFRCDNFLRSTDPIQDLSIAKF